MKKTNENGITLIALVVTIVVLLILAGITITYVMADGGIFDSAKTAASQTIISQISDYASQVQATYMTQMTVKSATGVTPSTDAKADLTGTITEETEGTVTALIQKFFPAGAKGDGTDEGYKVVGPVNLTGDGEGMITTGNYKVKHNGITYNVSYSNGAVTVAEAE